MDLALEIQKQICTIQRFLPLKQSDRTDLLTRFANDALDERRKKKKGLTKADHDITVGKMAKLEEKVADLLSHDYHEAASLNRLKLELHLMFPQLVEKEIIAVAKRYSDHIWQALHNLSKHCYPEEHVEDMLITPCVSPVIAPIKWSVASLPLELNVPTLADPRTVVAPATSQ